MHTDRLGFLIAHRPGFVAPTLAARKIATFDHLTNGRIALHIISGASDAEQEGDGDFAPKEERYRRAAEYIEVMKLAWTSERRFDFSGEFYRVHGAKSDVQPLQKPHPPLFFGGSSEGALAMGSKHCDVFAMFGEPLAPTAQRIAEFRARAAQYGRSPTFNMSFRPILGATEGAAWDRARRILASIQKPGDPTGFGNNKKPLDQSARRLLDFAAAGRDARRAAMDADRRGDRRDGQHLVPGRHARAGRPGLARILQARHPFVPDARLRSLRRHGRLRPRVDPAPAGGRRGARSREGRVRLSRLG